MKKNYNSKNNKKGNKQRQEHLSTSIGDILKAKGMLLPEVETKKSNEPAVKFDMKNDTSDNNDVVIRDGSWDEMKALMAVDPGVLDVKPADTDKITINAEYITKEGTDKKVRTDTFVNKE